jgi:hypothetical protein
MPTFQQAAFIRRALDSLCAQSLPDWELHVVDDGSTDATQTAVVPYLEDPRIRYARFERNRGLGADLNYALERHQSLPRALRRPAPAPLPLHRGQLLAPRHLHLHGQVDQGRWVCEFSRYDVGWLHVFKSENGGDVRRANWDDLNYPARMATLIAAGLPLLQYDNHGAVVAAQALARELNVGVFFSDYHELHAQLLDAEHMEALRANVWQAREQFTFDYHADRLIAFFRQVIASRR